MPEQSTTAALRALILRDYPQATLVKAVEVDGGLVLDEADSARIEDESFHDFADDTRAAASADWAQSAPGSRVVDSPLFGRTAFPRRGEWEMSSDDTSQPTVWALVVTPQ